jgi:hypothetical protein
VKWVSSQQRGGSTIFSHWSHIFLNETYVSGAVVSDGGSEKYVDSYALFEIGE